LDDSAVARAVALATERSGEGPPLLAIVGPTASGKTELAIAVAERVGGEIVSADSVQIYRGFDIGSGKPTAAERARATHHLIDAVEPTEAIDAAAYAAMAERVLADVRARGRIPILCGGTFFWVRALVLGLVAAPAADAAIRARHRAVVEAQGRAALHAELARLDPRSASRLHPNDVVRVSRALEVLELSRRTMSEWQESHGFRARRHEVALVGLRVSPEELSRRIARRAEAWLGGGWVDEVRTLLARGHGETRAMGSIGYKEVRAHLAGELSAGALLPAIVQSTRTFARRQRTWLKHADVAWL
jgi:tRNA dimethylallyltransferase